MQTVTSLKPRKSNSLVAWYLVKYPTGKLHIAHSSYYLKPEQYKNWLLNGIDRKSEKYGTMFLSKTINEETKFARDYAQSYPEAGIEIQVEPLELIDTSSKTSEKDANLVYSKYRRVLELVGQGDRLLNVRVTVSKRGSSSKKLK